MHIIRIQGTCQKALFTKDLTRLGLEPTICVIPNMSF